MTAPSAHTGPLAARTFFLGGESSDVQLLDRSLRERRVLSGVGHGLDLLDARTRALLDRELAAVTTRLLDIDLGDVLMAGWRTHRALREAGRRSLATAPNGEELVELARHTVTSTYAPEVDLVLNGTTITTVEVTISLSVQVDALVAVLRAGRLEGLRSGFCLATLEIEVEGQPVINRERTFEAPLHVRLGSGVDLA